MTDENFSLLMEAIELSIGDLVAVRSVDHGCCVGRLAGGVGRSVALRDSIHLHSWNGTGGKGTLYDLLRDYQSATCARSAVQQRVIVHEVSDITPISEEVYRHFAELERRP